MSGINKIVFFVSSPLSERDYKRFGIETLMENGFEVEIWDFAPLFNPKRLRDKSNFKIHCIFSDKKSVISAISQLTKGCLVVFLISYSPESYAIYRTVSKHKIPYCIVVYNFPSGNVERVSVFKRIRSITFKKLLLYLFSRAPYKFIGIQSAAIMIAMGSKFNWSTSPVGKRTRILWLHNYDYDIYLEEIKKPMSINQNLAVFLDNYLPFHPDAKQGSLGTPDEYYPFLCRFFDYVERQNDVRIVIAAHPRSNYELHPDYFAGRDIVKGRTAELVRKSRFVISHASASINFAVLFKKPIIFTTTDRLSQCRELFYMDFMASLLGKRLINLNNVFEIDWDRELIVNEEAYKIYKNTYIKQDGTEEIPIWQAFSDYLKNAEKSVVKSHG